MAVIIDNTTETTETVTAPTTTTKTPPTIQEQIILEKNPARRKVLELKAQAEQAATDKKIAEAKARAQQAQQAKETKQANAPKKTKKAPTKANHPPVPSPTLAPAPALPALPQAIQRTLKEGTAAEALKAAWSADNNAELGYKQLAERYKYSIVPLVEDLAKEKVWPVEPKGSKREGQPLSYKKLYNLEKENGIKSWGHMVNRASERFAMVNPENIKKREEEKQRKAEEAKANAANAASQIAKKAKGASTPATKLDTSKLSHEDLFAMAKEAVVAMDAAMRDLFLADGDIRQILSLP